MGMLFVESKLIETMAYNGGTINSYENGEIYARSGEFGDWRKFNTIRGAKLYISREVTKAAGNFNTLLVKLFKKEI